MDDSLRKTDFLSYILDQTANTIEFGWQYQSDTWYDYPRASNTISCHKEWLYRFGEWKPIDEWMKMWAKSREKMLAEGKSEKEVDKVIQSVWIYTDIIKRILETCGANKKIKSLAEVDAYNCKKQKIQ